MTGAPHRADRIPAVRSARSLEADLTRCVEDHWGGSPECSGATWTMNPCEHAATLMFSCAECNHVVMVVGAPEDECLLEFERRAAEPVTRTVHMGALSGR